MTQTPPTEESTTMKIEITMCLRCGMMVKPLCLYEGKSFTCGLCGKTFFKDNV